MLQQAYGVRGLKKMATKVWCSYQRNHRTVDAIALGTMAAALILAWEFDRLPGGSASRSVTLFATIAGLSGTLLGFGITSIAILIGLFQAPEFGPLRKNDDYGSLFSDYKLAIVLLAATTLFALGATAAAAARLCSPIVLGVALGLVGWSSVTMVHAVDILWLAIKTHVKAEQDF